MFRPGSPAPPFNFAVMGAAERRRMAAKIPAPALVGLVAPDGSFVAIQDGLVAVGAPAVAADTTLAPISVADSDLGRAVESSQVERSAAEDARADRTATSDDYARLLVPLGTSGFAFTIVSDLAGARNGVRSGARRSSSSRSLRCGTRTSQSWSRTRPIGSGRQTRSSRRVSRR